jgi:hypothetical protein
MPLGQEYLLTDAGQLIPVHETSLVGGPATPASVSVNNTSSSPASTLVGASTGLQINLIWDSSVTSASNWSAVEASVVKAAQIYTTTFGNHAVLNIQVGLGEVAGSAMGSGDLGESESNGYVVGLGMVQPQLAQHDAWLVHSGRMASNATNALNGLSGESFFVTSAECKALGLVSGNAPGVDGYIGIARSGVDFNGGAIPGGQYDAVGVAAHELSEVMGRLGMQGKTFDSTPSVYTPLDLFRYSSPGHPDTTPTAGYLSLTNGVSSLGAYNNPQGGGDSSDWASSMAANNAFNAFGSAGMTDVVTKADMLEVAALGFTLASGHILTSFSA